MLDLPPAGGFPPSQVRPFWRKRILLLAVAEGIVVVALALVVWRLVLPQRPRPRPAVTSSPEPEAPAPSPPVLPVARVPTVQVFASASPGASQAPVAASPSTAASTTVLLPEHVPELDAFFKLPPDSASWTPEQRKAYFDEALRKLDEKDRSLARELDLAMRRGDTRATEQASLTLEHFRSRGWELRRVYGPADAGP
jgi:hypothetical protein